MISRGDSIVGGARRFPSAEFFGVPGEGSLSKRRALVARLLQHGDEKLLARAERSLAEAIAEEAGETLGRIRDIRQSFREAANVALGKTAVVGTSAAVE